MLKAKLALHGIDDVEAFAAAIVHRSKLELSYHDREDLVAYLLAECWQLSLSYDQSRGSFSTYAGAALRLRLVDWQRRRFGRTRWAFHDRVIERPRVGLVSLDDAAHDGLATALGARAGDPTADRSPDLTRVLGAGNRARARDYEALGLRPPRRAT